jgi:hypothetical protein
MAIDYSTALFGGPGKLYWGSAGYWAKGDITASVEPSTSPVVSSLFGQEIDEQVTDIQVKVTFDPESLWQNTAALFANFLAPSIGTRIFGSATPLVIWGSNGDKVTVQHAALTKPPTLTLGPGPELFGSAEFTGLVIPTGNVEDADSLYTSAAGAADPGGVYAWTNWNGQTWTAAWGAVTGFTEFVAKDKWTVEVQPMLEPIQVQGLTRDMQIVGCKIAARCIPIGPTTAQVDAAAKLKSDAGAKLGHRLGANSATLTITGADAKAVAIKNAALQKTGQVFGRPLRTGEVAFVSSLSFTAGAPDALMTIT